MVKTQTKTKTIIAVALTVLSIGSMLAGLYYYSARTKVKKTGGDSSSSSQTSPTAKISVSPGSLSFGEMEINTSQNKSVAVKNTGGASLVLGAISVSGAGFSRNGGTCGDNQTLAPQSSCAATVQFTPAEEKDYSGTLTIKSNDVTKIVSLSGEGEKENGGGAGGSGGNTEGGGGNVDLVLSGSIGVGSSFEEGMNIYTNVTVKNQGTNPSGPFAVIGDYNGNKVTWQVSNLNGGESQRHYLYGSAGGAGGIHSYCSFTVTADASNQVTETNENNNIIYGASLRAR